MRKQKRKQEEYIASAFARRFSEDFKLRKGMTPEEVKETILQDGQPVDRYEGGQVDELVVLGCCFSGYLETRQAYRFSRSCVESLQDSRLDFQIASLRIPFESFFLDFQNLEIQIDEKKVLGCFLRRIGEPEHCVCYTALLRGDHGGIRLMKGALQYENGKTLEEQIDDVYGGYTGEREFHHTVFTLIAYISSDEPDVQDKGRETVIVHVDRKRAVPSTTRFWDVGYRYFTERPGRAADEAEARSTSTGCHSPHRPHIRKGHWHTYRCGPGRTQTKVSWVQATKVGKGEIVDVIRTRGQPKGS